MEYIKEKPMMENADVLEAPVEKKTEDTAEAAKALEKVVTKTAEEVAAKKAEEIKKEEGIFAKIGSAFRKGKEALMGNPEEALKQRTAITITSAIKRGLIKTRPTEAELAAYYEAAKNDPDKAYKGRPTFKTGKLAYENWKDVPTENPLAGGGTGGQMRAGGV